MKGLSVVNSLVKLVSQVSQVSKVNNSLSEVIANCAVDNVGFNFPSQSSDK